MAKEKQKRQRKEKKDFIVRLPSTYDLDFDVATPQYADIPKLGVSFASNGSVAVRGYLFRLANKGIIDQIVAKRISSALEDLPHKYEGCAFEVPQIVAEDRQTIPSHLYEILQEGALADDLMAGLPGIRNPLAEARRLLEFYRTNRVGRA